MTADELDDLRRRLGREPRPVEVQIVAAEWSEHCSYKSSKIHLRMLPATGPQVIAEKGYDSGVLDVGDGYVVTAHIESHNHPSAVEPYGGAATGVGGVIRDILSTGTRPVCILDGLRFGDTTRSPAAAKSRWLFKNAVTGIADYGNCLGIPTIGGEIEFDSCYDNYALVDVAAVGFGRRGRLIKNHACKGDIVLLLGGHTGRDGIGGSQFASDAFESEDRSAVQIPDPFMEKLLIEAVLEARNTGAIKAMKDLGGGGLSCAISETAESLGVGIEMDVQAVHTREDNMVPEEIMISESQERMLIITDSAGHDKIMEICSKFEIVCSAIGRVTDDGAMRVMSGPDVAAEMPADVVANARLLDLPSKRPAYLDGIEDVMPASARLQQQEKEAEEAIRPSQSSSSSTSSQSSSSSTSSQSSSQSSSSALSSSPTTTSSSSSPPSSSQSSSSSSPPSSSQSSATTTTPSLEHALFSLLSSPNIASRSWVYSQYDHEVGIRTIVRPGADASVLRLDNGKYLAISMDGNPKHCYINPREGAIGCFEEACRNVVCTGARPIGMLDHMQFGDPTDPEIFWTFLESLRGVSEFARHAKIPCIGGKVSLYNETAAGPIKPTPVIMVLGLIDDGASASRNARRQIRQGDNLLIVGTTGREMGGSEYYEHVLHFTGGRCPVVDMDASVKNADAVIRIVKDGLADSVHDCSKGGIAVGASEMSLASGMGCTMDAATIPRHGTNMGNCDLLFSESHSRYLLAVGDDYMDRVRQILSEHGVIFAHIGKFGCRKDRIVIRDGTDRLVDLSVDKAYERWSGTLKRLTQGHA